MVSAMEHCSTPIGHDLIASSLVCGGILVSSFFFMNLSNTTVLNYTQDDLVDNHGMNTASKIKKKDETMSVQTNAALRSESIDVRASRRRRMLTILAVMVAILLLMIGSVTTYVVIFRGNTIHRT